MKSLSLPSEAVRYLGSEGSGREAWCGMHRAQLSNGEEGELHWPRVGRWQQPHGVRGHEQTWSLRHYDSVDKLQKAYR